MEENLILEGLLSMVTELKEKQEQQVTPASREETINRLDVIEQRILESQRKPTIPENMVQEILSQIASIKKGQSENQKQDLEDIKGLIVASHRYFKDYSLSETEILSFFSRNTHLPCVVSPEYPFCGTNAAVTGQ